MLNQVPFALISNFLSIIIVFLLFYKYLQYKKKLDVIKQLDIVENEGSLTEEDIAFITDNEKEYKEKVIKTEANIKLSNPAFIIVGGLIFISFPFADALMHLNVVVVGFLFMQIDRLHKKNLYKFLYDLKAKI